MWSTYRQHTSNGCDETGRESVLPSGCYIGNAEKLNGLCMLAPKWKPDERDCSATRVGQRIFVVLIVQRTRWGTTKLHWTHFIYIARHCPQSLPPKNLRSRDVCGLHRAQSQDLLPLLMDAGNIIFRELSGSNFLRPPCTFVMLNRSTVNGKVSISNCYSL